MRPRLFFSLLFLLPALLPAQTLRMRDAVQTALQNNLAIRQKQERVQHAEAVNAASVGAFLPKIGVTGGYTWFNTTPKINMEMVKPALDDLFGKYGTVMAKELGLSDQSQEEIYNIITGGLEQLPAYDLEVLFRHFPNANVYAMQPIFTGGKISNMKNIATIENDVAGILLESTRDLVTEETVSRYLKVLLSQRLCDTRRTTLRVMQEHARQTGKMIDNGVLPRHFSIQAEVAVSKAEAALEQEQNNLNIALIRLKEIMGCSRDSVFTLGDSLVYHPAVFSVDSLMTLAETSQTGMLLADKKKEMSERMYKAEVANLMPQVYAYANYSFFNEKMPVIMPPLTMGVQLNYTFFTGGSHYKMTKAAKHLTQEAVLSKEEARDKLYLLITTTAAMVKNSETLYLKLASTERLAEENFRIVNKRFREGLSKPIEVLDSQTVLEDTRLERYAALFAYYQALAILYLAAGHPETILNMF